MPPISDTIEESVAKQQANADALEAVVNGAVDDPDVALPIGGTAPTMRKAIQDGVTAASAAASIEAEQYKDDAEAAAAQAAADRAVIEALGNPFDVPHADPNGNVLNDGTPQVCIGTDVHKPMWFNAGTGTNVGWQPFLVADTNGNISIALELEDEEDPNTPNDGVVIRSSGQVYTGDGSSPMGRHVSGWKTHRFKFSSGAAFPMANHLVIDNAQKLPSSLMTRMNNSGDYGGFRVVLELEAFWVHGSPESINLGFSAVQSDIGEGVTSVANNGGGGEILSLITSAGGAGNTESMQKVCLVLKPSGVLGAGFCTFSLDPNSHGQEFYGDGNTNLLVPGSTADSDLVPIDSQASAVENVGVELHPTIRLQQDASPLADIHLAVKSRWKVIEEIEVSDPALF